MLFETFRLQDLPGTDARSCDLRSIGRTDSAESRPDLLSFGCPVFIECIQEFMPRHDELASGTDLNIGNTDSARFQILHFLCKSRRIDHDAVADDIDDLFAEDPGRDQVQNIFFRTVFDSMTGIVPALKADNHFRITGEHIYYFTFTLVTPLDADKYIDRHVFHNFLILLFFCFLLLSTE